ncbi:hypothetical protein IG631_14078 [Alternaria alternata]|nr:hypothetical protein IG631_14078 [Alternaria alternata]
MLSSSSCQDISFYRRKRSHTYGSISSLNWRSGSTILEASQNYCCGSIPANAYDGRHEHWFTRTWCRSSFHRNGQKPEIPHLIRVKTIISSQTNPLGYHYISLSFNIHANEYHRYEYPCDRMACYERLHALRVATCKSWQARSRSHVSGRNQVTTAQNVRLPTIQYTHSKRLPILSSQRC